MFAIPSKISRLRKTITPDLITTAENHIMRISRDSSDIAICAARYRECGANRGSALRKGLPTKSNTARGGAQLSPNKNARQRVVTLIDPAFW
jgi:hypothetical protein